MTETEQFKAALEWLAPIEGGWYPGNRKRDRNPTMWGITQKVYDAYRDRNSKPKQSVRLIDRDEHDEIYQAEYWQAARCRTLTWPVSLVHFDAAVNHGVGNARKLYRRIRDRLGFEPSFSPRQFAERYISLRREFYRAIVEHDPDMEPNLNGWLARMDKLAKLVEKTA